MNITGKNKRNFFITKSDEIIIQIRSALQSQQMGL